MYIFNMSRHKATYDIGILCHDYRSIPRRGSDHATLGFDIVVDNKPHGVAILMLSSKLN